MFLASLIHVSGYFLSRAVQSIVHNLVLQFMNRTMNGTDTSEASLQRPTAAQKEKERKEQEEKDAAEKALDEEIEKVSPTLQAQYENEVHEHQEQNRKMDAVSRLLTAMTNAVSPSCLSEGLIPKILPCDLEMPAHTHTHTHTHTLS